MNAFRTFSLAAAAPVAVASLLPQLELPTFTLDTFMADPSNLYLSASEAKLIRLVSLLVIIERCDASLQKDRRGSWYSRAVLLTNLPLGAYVLYSLWNIVRPIRF